jgi:hypothetical protein
MKDKRIPTWLLERIVLDEVPPDRAAEVRRILDEDPAERARVAELEQSNAEILAALPPAAVAAEVARRAASSRSRDSKHIVLFGLLRSGDGRDRRGNGLHRSRGFALASSAALAAAVAVVAVVAVRDPEPTGRPTIGLTEPPDTTREKGNTRVGEEGRAEVPTRLLLHRKGTRKPELLDLERDEARAGDLVQLSYQAAGDAAYGVILSIDGEGKVQLHYPAERDGSTRLERRAVTALEHAYELDAAPGFERFFFITSPEPIDAAGVADVLSRAESLARDARRRAHDPISLDASLKQVSFTLRKEAAP